MSVKLQWLAYPCFAFAALALAHAIYIVGITFDEPDFAPALGVFVAIRINRLFLYSTRSREDDLLPNQSMPLCRSRQEV